jgi:hypothetical protein
MKAVIFAGPSLPPNARPSDPWLDWRPPVRQGELYRAALERPAIIGVIDGYFETVPTVWHKEILWAMAQGIHVYGAASTGALRAAELDAFGMKGIGRIYEDFRDRVLEDDDEVAVLHGPAELGYPLVSDAMVNIRTTLAAAAVAGVVARDVAAHVTDVAKSLFYKDRTWTVIRGAAVRANVAVSALDVLAAWLPRGTIDQKRRDALAMMDAIRAHRATGVTPLQVTYGFAETAAWCAAVDF